MGKIDIRGLDLKIDQAVHKLCEVYNSSSGSTRSVLYVLLLVNILSLIAVINTHKHNWLNDRIDVAEKNVGILYEKKWELEKRQKINPMDSLDYMQILDTLNYKLSIEKSRRDYNEKNKVDKYQNVQLPVLGNSFDMNNLGLISGISFIILLGILRFTLTREKNNLRIALQSITERYVDDVIEKEFSEEVTKFKAEDGEVINHINKTRRKHHYNFLSMNEVFNLPLLEVSDNALQKTYIGKQVNRNIFYFPYFIYIVIFFNDVSTIFEALKISPLHTSISTLLSYLCLWAISYLCKSCNIQKRTISNLFLKFYSNNYKYRKVEQGSRKDSSLDKALYPFYPLYKGIADIFRSIRKN